VLLLIHGDLAERGVEVSTRITANLPLVSGDHIQLQQVLLNLVMNACDAMHENAPQERKVVIEAQRDGGDSVKVSVVDRGRGIPSEAVEQVFEPFFSTKSTGLGMGLSICRAIVESHGGRLWVTNNSDRGATFHFTLPAAKQEADKTKV
jgi:signal transduction histidine kinase